MPQCMQAVLLVVGFPFVPFVPFTPLFMCVPFDPFSSVFVAMSVAERSTKKSGRPSRWTSWKEGSDSKSPLGAEMRVPLVV